jgi:hypothetical protein
MWDQHYRVLILTAGVRERMLASKLLASCGHHEENCIDYFELDIRYQALAQDAINSPYRPNFFVGAVLGTRGGTSLLTIRTFASRCFQDKRGSLWEDEIAVDDLNDAKIDAACEMAVRSMFDEAGGVVWQSQYDDLWQCAEQSESDAAKLGALWLGLPDHLRETVFRLP